MRTKLTFKGHRIEVHRSVDELDHVTKTIVIDGTHRFPYSWPTCQPLGCMAFAKAQIDSWPNGKAPETPVQKVVSVRFG